MIKIIMINYLKFFSFIDLKSINKIYNCSKCKIYDSDFNAYRNI